MLSNQRTAQPPSSATDDLPFYNNRPFPIGTSGWSIIIVATIAAFLALVMPPMADLKGPLSLVPAILFSAIPLAALALVSGGHWTALFRRFDATALGRAALFAIVTIALSFLAGLALQGRVPLKEIERAHV